MFKVTWTTSSFIHGTNDGQTTICGHNFGGPPDLYSVRGILHKKKKRHCRTCFKTRADFKSRWLMDNLNDNTDEYKKERDLLREVLGLEPDEIVIKGKDGRFLCQNKTGHTRRLDIMLDEIRELERLREENQVQKTMLSIYRNWGT